MLNFRLRPAGTGAAILYTACAAVAMALTPLADAPPAPPAPPASAEAPETVRRRATVGILPVASGVDPVFAPLQEVVGLSLDEELGKLNDTRLVDRSHLASVFDELVLTRQNRSDLRAGRVVGADAVLAASIVTDSGEVRLDLKLIETATGNLLHREIRRLASAPATAKSAARELSAASDEVVAGVRSFKAALAQPLRTLTGRPDSVDVAVLPFGSGGTLGADPLLAEALRRAFADHVAATVPGARVLHRDLAEFALDEATLAAGAIVDEPRRTTPAASVIVVRGVLTNELAPGATLSEAALSLRIEVGRGEHTRTLEVTGALKEAAALKREAATGVATAVGQLVGPSPNVATGEVAARQANRREAADSLAEAARHLPSWLLGGRRDEDVTNLAIQFATRAALLSPDDSQPFEVVWGSLMADLPGAAPWDARLSGRGGIPREAHPARLLRQQFIRSFPGHPLWPSAVAKELQDIGPNFSGAVPARPQDRAGGIDLAGRFADAVLSGEVTLDPRDFLSRNRSCITIDPVEAVDMACRALMSAGQLGRAWELTMSACEQIDAARDEPRGYLMVDHYLCRALHLQKFDAAWRAADYFRSNYPGFVALGGIGEEFERTPLDELRQAGLLAKWQPLLNAIAPATHPRWADAALADLQALPSRAAHGRHTLDSASHLAVPAAAGAGAVLLSASTEGLKGNDALRPWCILLQPQPRTLLLWRGGAADVTPLSVPPPSVTADGVNAAPPSVASFDGVLYLLTGGSLYRVNPATGACEPLAKNLPPSANRGLSSLSVHGASLYVTGGENSNQPTATRFIFRRDAGKDGWRAWPAPAGAGPVTRLLGPSNDGRLFALHGATQRIEAFDPEAADPSHVFGERRSIDRRFQQLAATATDGAYTLRLPLGGGSGWIYLFDHQKQQSRPLYFLPATAPGADHRPFWRPTVIGDRGPEPDRSPAALPLADAPADVAADPLVAGRFWILDRRGGLTAFEPAQDRAAGPFIVAEHGAALTRTGDGLIIAHSAGVALLKATALMQLVENQRGWRTTPETYRDTADGLRCWANDLPPLLGGIYYHEVHHPELAEAALESVEEIPDASAAAAYRIEHCAAAGRLDMAVALMRPFLGDPARIDDPALEKTILLTLQNARRWDLLEPFLPKLWRDSPLRGGRIPAAYRAIAQVALIRSRPSREAAAALAELRAGKLPEVPWRWDKNPTYRCMARLLRRQAMPPPS